MTDLVFLRTPVEGYPITGPFGATSPDPWSPDHPHLGVDFGCPTGTMVIAPATGRVVAFANDGTFGDSAICLQHEGTPWYTLYAHLDSNVVTIGQLVNEGQLIGLSGAKGFVTAAHLHWQCCNTPAFPLDITTDIDPLSLLPQPEAPMTPAELQDFDNLKLTVAALRLACFSGNEEGTLADSVRFANADYRVAQRVHGASDGTKADSLGSLIQSVGAGGTQIAAALQRIALLESEVTALQQGGGGGSTALVPRIAAVESRVTGIDGRLQTIEAET